MKKTLLFLVTGVALLLSACTQDSENPVALQQDESKVKELYTMAQKIILTDCSSDDIASYFSQDWGTCCSSALTRSMGSEIDTKMNTYLKEHGLEEDELEAYLEENPFELTTFIRETIGGNFANYYEMIQEPSNVETLLSKIYNDARLTSTEKTILFLLISSELDSEHPKTRSAWSCLKRYAKLTVVSVNTLKISITDVQAGVEYAQRELENMGEEYKC